MLVGSCPLLLRTNVPCPCPTHPVHLGQEDRCDEMARCVRQADVLIAFALTRSDARGDRQGHRSCRRRSVTSIRWLIVGTRAGRLRLRCGPGQAGWARSSSRSTHLPTLRGPDVVRPRNQASELMMMSAHWWVARSTRRRNAGSPLQVVKEAGSQEVGHSAQWGTLPLKAEVADQCCGGGRQDARRLSGGLDCVAV